VDATVNIDTISPYAHTGLTAGSTHSYRVRAKNSVGTSAWSAISSATTSSVATDIALNKAGTASSVESSGFEAGKAFDGNTTSRWASIEGSDPQWIYVDLITSYDITRVKLSWEDAYAKSYRIEVSSDKTNWTSVYSTTSGNGATDDISFNSTSGRYVRMYGTQRGTAYGYSLYGFEVYGGESAPQVPAVPTGLAASAASTSQINVSWGASSGATGYDLEVDGTVNSDKISPYAHTDLTANSTHSYRVRAKNSVGTSAWSSTVSATTSAAPQVPAIPTGLAASAASTSQINVSWGASSGATGYDLEVDGTINSDKISPYAHTGLTANSTHSYRVRAKNSMGTSAWSSAVSATTLQIVGGVARPFPQNLSYAGCIKPNQTQQQLNNDVISAYTSWKNNYLKTSSVTAGGYYVYATGVTGEDVVDPITCSEAHGYGMMTTALMAGYDSNAKTYFDGLYKMYNAHRSPIDNDLMAWAIGRSERAADCGGSAATDGDMDIAYGLLLAHYQWGSTGSINYLSEAKRIINNGLKGSEVSTSSYRTLLGDWNTSKPYETRSSDWMTDHFRVFYSATGDSFWNNVTSTSYGIINRMHLNYSQNTGLVPDFVIGNPAQPAPPKFLEFEEDGDYGYNACRYPWRIATDYALFGTADAKTAMNKMINWLKTKTSNNPNNITACYDLSTGTALHPDETSMAFTSPFIAACIVDSAHQNYLNSGWNIMKSSSDGYYGDSINLLCMILISGNWWAPQ